MTNEANAQPEHEEAVEAPLDTAVVEAELAKARDDVLRALAEVENTRRRAERQVQEARAYAIDRFATDLLPVADTLSRALTAAPAEWRASADESARNLLAGLEMTERTLVDVFARNGLKRVGAIGEAFNPAIHQAVAHAPSPHPSGTVLEVMQPGYVLGDRTVRAAMVAVSAGPGSGTGDAQTVDIKV